MDGMWIIPLILSFLVPAASQTCEQTDCVLSAWGTWSVCTVTCGEDGTRRREQLVLREAACGGMCPDSLFEMEECNRHCCPVDCQYTPWSKWGMCYCTSDGCGGGGERYNCRRSRQLVMNASCGGYCDDVSVQEECGLLCCYRDCVTGPWSAWTACEAKCEQIGTKKRTRVVDQHAECEGEPCLLLEEVAACTGTCCPVDCVLGAWSKWSACNTTCGEGAQNRTRFVQQAACGGQACGEEPVSLETRNKTRRVTQSTDCGGTRCPSLLETRDCLVTEVIDCSFTAWSPWTACNTDCGEGVATRSRSLISPAYCGGKCMSEGLVEEKSCESYAAKQDCKASDWSEWGDCLRDCERGRQTRNRTMIANPSCGGAVCPDLTETRPCHEPCEQLCNGGVCLCRQGYTLNADHVTCTVITCVEPALDYCPPTHRYLIDCQYPKLQCSQGLTYNKTCAIFCKLTGWTLKGGVADIRCQQNATWTQPKMYCVRPNNAPLRVEIDRTHIDENKPAATCFAYLSTATTDGEQFERHTYAVVEDPTGRLHVKDNRVCLSRDSDYEETPQEWDVVFRSTDIEGLWVDTTITFHTVNHNDPPVSVKLVPDTLPENSPAGTEVGCLEGHDDDPGQNITFTLVSSDLAFHIETDTRGRQCLQLVKDSGSLCTIEGGNNCFLNFEKQAVHVITVLAVDDGTPPKSAYYEVNIYLSDVNDKQTAVSTKPAWIPEEISPGEPLVTMVTVDEDLGQTYTYRMLDDAGGLFRLVGDSLVATRRFDFETEKQLDFIVVVESVDDTNPEFRVTSNITLTVGDINEAPFELELLSLNGLRSFSKNQPSVEENIVGVFGTVTVKDYDAKDHVTIVMDSNDGMVDRLSLGETYCSSLPSLNVFCTARIDIVKPFNFEHTKVTWIVLHAVDGMRANTTLNLTLSVVDKNDPPSGILLNGRPDTVFSIAENMMDQVVSKLSAVDEDESDQHTFVVEQGPPGLFTVLGDTLKTTATARLNYERTQFYKLHIRCTDSGNPPMFALFDVTINVTDINEIPTATSLTNDKVEENSVAGTLVGELVTEDPDNELEPRQNFTYTLPDDSNGRFYLSGNKLLVKEAVQWCGAVRCTLNHELQSSLQVSVITMDTGTPKKTRTDKFTIQVLDVNDPPTHIKLNLDLVKENEPTSTVIGNFSAEDEDGKDKVSFSLVDNSDVFVILNGFTLTTKISLDYERLKSYWVTIQASDTNTPPGISEEVMKISVIDENETPIFMNMQTTINLPEDVQVGEPLKAFRISDPDSWDTLKSTIVDETDTFSITDLNCSTTLISGSTDCEFNLVLQKRLNFEIKQSYQLTLYVSDKQGLSSSSSLVVTVEDVNLAPEVQQNSSLDYEVLQSEELTMNVTVTDSGLPPQTISKFFKVIVEDVNEAPTELRITNNEVSEEAVIHTSVGTLLVTDDDLDQTYTFEILGSGVFIIDGNDLVVNNALNFEKSKSHEILVEVTDSGTPPRSRVFDIQINITDVNEPPTNITISKNVVPLDSPAGTVIGTLRVIDEDEDQLHSFESVGSGEIFGVSENGELVVVNLDGLAVGEIVEIEIKVTDDGNPPMSVREVLKIQIENIATDILLTSKNTEFQFENNNVQIPERIPVETQVASVELTSNAYGDILISVVEGSELFVITDIQCTVDIMFSLTKIQVKENSQNDFIGRFTVKDQDQLDKHSFRVAESDHLKVSSDGNLFTSPEAVLDYEDSTRLALTVTVSDSGNLTLSKAFDVIVLDVNDIPTKLSLTNNEIKEGASSGTDIGDFIVEDEDESQNFSLHLLRFNNIFKIENITLKVNADGMNCTKAMNCALDFETKSSYDLQVNVTDNGQPSIYKIFNVTVNVVDVNDPPRNIFLNSTIINENTPIESFVAQIYSYDDDAGQQHTFSVVGSDEFVAVGAHLITNALFNYEAQWIYIVNLTATDDGDPKLTTWTTFEIKVKNVNEPPFDLSVRATSESKYDFKVDSPVIDENVPSLTYIGEVLAFDEDDDDTLRFEAMSSHNILIDGSNVSLVHCPENTKSAVLGSLTAEDEEDGQSYSFTLIGEQSFFYIADAKLWVTSAANLDYEKQSIYSLTIRVTDNGIPIAVFDKAFIIQLTDENESPTNLYLNNTKVSELAVSGDMIGQFYVEDPDKDNEDHEIRILDESVSKFEIKKHLLVVKDGSFDYENTNMYSVMFDVIDKGNPPMSATFTISVEVTDANEPPEQLKFSGNEIEENVAIGTSVGVFSARDPDIGQSLTFSIDGVNGSLSVNGVDLIVSGNIDFEANSVLKFNATVYDDGAQTMFIKKEFIIPILDVNEAPNKIRNLTVLEILESSTVSTVIATFEISDPDSVERITAKIIKGENIFDTSGLQCKETLGSSVCVVSVHLKKQLDFETNKGPTPLEFEVEDKGGLTFRKTFYFNDIIIDTEIVGIPENSPHFVVGSLVSIDDDENDKHTYQVITFWESFTTVGNKLVTKVPFDYEKKPVYELMIRSTDNGNPRMSFAKQFVINVTDVNEEPEDILVSPMKIKRNAKVGETVGVFTVIDPDNVRREGFQTHICTLASSEWLQIPQNKLHFTINKEIPPDAGTISITITCTDNGTPPLFLTQEFNLEIVDRVIPPKEIVVLNLDGGQTLLVSENENKIIEFVFELEETTIFTIDDTTLVLKDELDFESFPEITVTIFARDAGTNGDSLNISGSFKINVMDVNEAPYGIELQGVQSVPENSLQGFAIGVLYTFDHENYQTYAYRISGVSYGFSVDENDQDIFDTFSIEGSILKVGSGYQNIDYELSDIISVLLETTDSGEPEYTLREVIHLKIEDTNDPPTEIQLTQNIIVENSPEGTVIGTLVITDPDIGQDHICEIINLIDVPFKIVDSKTLALSSQTVDFERQNTYNVMISFSLDPQSDRGFEIKGDATLIAPLGLDYETKRFHSIVIVAEDEEGQFATMNFEIEVLDVNETPLNITLSKTHVGEHAKHGENIGILSTVDPDFGQTFTYSLNQITLSEGKVEIQRNQLNIGENGLDFETSDTIRITIRSTDNGIPPEYKEIDFTIHIIDENDPPSGIIVGQVLPVSEDTSPHTTILTFEVEDSDVNQTHSCFIKGDGNYFLVTIKTSGPMGLLLTNELDYEENNEYQVIIACSDGEYEITKNITIQVEDVNEAPFEIKLSGSNTIKADSTPGLIIGELQVYDEDFDQTHAFIIIGEHADLLKVTDDNVLVLKNAIPEDTKKSSDPSLIFEIEVSDNGNPVLTYRQLFHLPLTQDDVLYAGLPDLLFNDVKVLATQTQGYNLGNLIANDMVKDSLEISLEENFEGLFKIKDHVYLALAKNASLMTTPSGIILVTLFDSETLESKSHRIIVEIVQSSTCETITCEHNEHCITYNETRGSCECDDDFSRIDNTCVSKDDCDGIYCQNNGTCVDQVNTFVCKCIGIYTGQYCEIDPEVDSQCNPNPCKNGGICIPKSDEFTCSCQNGWAGDTCAENIDDCQMAICYNGGTCRDRQLTYICDCTSDWKGLRCEYHEHICLDKNCNNTHGCISLALTETSLCAETNIYLVALEYVRPEDLDIEEFQARLVEFVINYGRIAKHGYTGIRRRREVIEEIEVYVAESSESLDVFTFELYVIRSKHEVLTKDAVLTILAFTCLDIIAVVAAILTIVMVIFKKKNQIKPEETSLDASSRNTYASMPKEDVHTDKRSEAQTSVSKSSAERAVDECIEPFTTDHEMLLANTDSGSKPPTSSFTCGDVPQTLKNQDDTNYLKLTSAKSDKMHTTGIGSRTRYTSDYYIFQRNRDQEVTPVEMTESKV
ncbi:FAT4-like protein [Mya arenaria]|uniref:FAT4-like protein n=1 Tax=Mya arenaria TaxID=6604 RepID=A0ABY7F949_MYAAR|nr:FAT4-like protein [Mya arenaria]